jgi:hypothetical protein
MASHPEYFEWQTAEIYFFIRGSEMPQAEPLVREELARRQWAFLKYLARRRLDVEQARNKGGEVWDAHLHAQEDGLFVKVVPEQFGAGKNGPPLIRPARISESFMTDVIIDAGGRRVIEDNSPQTSLNADYLLGDFIFELKDLQEEAQEKEEHQAKIAALFAPYSQGLTAVSVDPSLLSKADLWRYLEILGGPLQRHVKKASKQVKATRTLLDRPDLRGGLILLNTGFSSYPHDLFAEQVERYAKKDSSQFEAVISITIWMETNGFDSYVFYRFSPADQGPPEVMAIRQAFDNRFRQMMTDLMRGLLPGDVEQMLPRRPIAFSVSGIDFNWEPPRIPFPWDKTKNEN